MKYRLFVFRSFWIFPLPILVLDFEQYREAWGRMEQEKQNPRTRRLILGVTQVDWRPLVLSRKHSLHRVWKAIRNQRIADR